MYSCVNTIGSVMNQEHAGDEQGPVVPISPKRRPWWRRLVWIVPLAIVALLVAVAAVVTFVPLSNPETGAGLEIEGTKIESRSDFTMTTTVANAGINSLYPLE